MYVEKTTAEDRSTIYGAVDHLFAQFETCSHLLQDIIENTLGAKARDVAEWAINPDLFYDRLWVIQNLMFDSLLEYHLMMGEGDRSEVQVHLKGVETARKTIAEEEARRQEHRRELEARGGK